MIESDFGRFRVFPWLMGIAGAVIAGVLVNYLQQPPQAVSISRPTNTVTIKPATGAIAESTKASSNTNLAPPPPRHISPVPQPQPTSAPGISPTVSAPMEAVRAGVAVKEDREALHLGISTSRAGVLKCPVCSKSFSAKSVPSGSRVRCPNAKCLDECRIP